jgi:hypothetical protein
MAWLFTRSALDGPLGFSGGARMSADGTAVKSTMVCLRWLKPVLRALRSVWEAERTSWTAPELPMAAK